MARSPAMASRPGPTIEVAAAAQLAGGLLAYTLRRSPRARAMRVTVDPTKGVVVTLPPAGRRGWSSPDRVVLAFLADREAWIRRHLDRQQRLRQEIAARGGLRDGGLVRFRGELHRLQIVDPATGTRRSSVTREGDLEGDVLVVRLATRDRRATRRVVVVNRRGLHARAAAKLVEVARKFDATVVVVRDGNEVSALSIMGLMTLAASPGIMLDLRAKGRQAKEAVDALAALFASKFNED